MAENKALKERLSSQKKDALNAIKSLEKNESFIELMPVGFLIIQDGKVLRVNNTLLDALGYKADDITGGYFLDLIHPDERHNAIKIHKSWDSGRMTPDQYDAPLMTSDGGPAFFSIRCRRIRYQNRVAFLLILTCLKKRIELQLEKIKEEKAMALITMASGIKDKLGGFNGLLLEVQKQYRDAAPYGHNDFKGIFEMLEEASTKARRITDKLEIITESWKANDLQDLITFNLSEAIKGAVQTSTPTCRECTETRGIKIDLKTYLRSSSSIKGNFIRIKEAISNLINNAIEAMAESGDIYITTEDNNGDAHIYIQDNGTGIPDEVKARVFDPFFSTKKGSMGLGLSMSCSIIKGHHGNIDFTSKDGEGTIFHISIPSTVQKPASKSGGIRKKITDSQILILHRDVVAREVLSHLLKNRGCRIDMANNALECLGLLKKKPFDMVIADTDALEMRLPLFIKRCRKIIHALPIALILGKEDSISLTTFDGQEADLCIKKPVDINHVIKQISELLMARQ